MKRNWIDFVNKNITDSDNKTKALAVDWDLWVLTPGVPPKSVQANFYSEDQAKAERLAD